MVGDPLQIRGKKRIVLDEVQKIVRAGAQGAHPFAGKIFPYRYTCCAAGADPSLTLVVVNSGFVSQIKLFL
jgi:hypothetical protein